MRSAVVTGASTGIGEAIAADLVKAGWRVFGMVRKDEDALRLQRELGGAFVPLIADVTDVASLSRAAVIVTEALGDTTLDGLVCNAGISLPGPLLHQPLEEIDRQWHVNDLGQIATIQAFAHLVGAQEAFAGPPGRILLMSSVSGKIAWPFVGAYSASKHALEAFGGALRRELMPFGVDVILIAPGPIATPIWEKSAAAVDRSRYRHTIYGPLIERFEREVLARASKGLPATSVAEVVRKALTVARPRPRYTVSAAALTTWVGPMLLPARWLDRLAARALGLTRQR